ncbi:MAG: imidazole glycerol phosphate synthase subunit HisF, partial [Chitinophagaceae bacterium]|nr:imidazole glycerol phosphate synthase subunit HisF [Chitinophagaceae bacterium]
FIDNFGTMNINDDAALAASIFHFKEITIPELKGYLYSHHIPVRIVKED